MRSIAGIRLQEPATFRVLPYKYLARLLEAFGLKAIIVRPGLDGWNAISYKMTLEQMLESSGEPVKNWRKKKNRQ